MDFAIIGLIFSLCAIILSIYFIKTKDTELIDIIISASIIILSIIFSVLLLDFIFKIKIFGVY